MRVLGLTSADRPPQKSAHGLSTWRIDSNRTRSMQTVNTMHVARMEVPVGSEESRKSFEDQGYFLARALFQLSEVDEMREHFMRLRAEGPKPGDMGGDDTKDDADPLNRFARMINMHDWDEKSAGWQRDARLTRTAAQLIGDDVALCQTMLYFKPPGARGQAMHQDHQYLRKVPIVAAWLALDDCDDQNGQLVILPGSHRYGILPVEHSDMNVSFTHGKAVLPAPTREVGLDMKAGDA